MGHDKRWLLIHTAEMKNSAENLIELLERSLHAIRKRSSLDPKAAIILGSGLGGLANEVKNAIAIPYQDVPILPPPSAYGHAGQLILGYISDVPVIVFAGRSHLYEGHAVQATLGSVQIASALGADLCIASNAAGGLNPRFNVGDVVAIDSHINMFFETLMKNASSTVELSEMGNVHRASQPLYDRNLIARATEIATGLDFTLHRGTYLGTLGPTYETRAEYRAFRTLGADMVGMSTILEMITASQLGMKTLAFSVITNVANPDCPTETTHDEVLDVAKVAQKRLLPLVTSLLSSIA